MSVEVMSITRFVYPLLTLWEGAALVHENESIGIRHVRTTGFVVDVSAEACGNDRLLADWTLFAALGTKGRVDRTSVGWKL
jgi:hypothetical protein